MAFSRSVSPGTKERTHSGSGGKASHARPSNPSFRVEWPDAFSSVPSSQTPFPPSHLSGTSGHAARNLSPARHSEERSDEESLCALPRLQAGTAPPLSS